MKIKKIISVIIPLCCLFASKGISQTTLHVTDPVLGNSSASLDQVLNQAITQANSGQNVTILFNAPGLCQITAQLPAISITNGSVTFDKNPAATVAQGIQYASGTVGYGILVNGNNAGTSVIIKNLSFKDFITAQSNIAISLFSTSHIDVLNCLFDNNDFGVLLNNLSNDILIQSNQFNNNSRAVTYVNSVDNPSNLTVQIKSNTISGTDNFGIEIISSAERDKTIFEIEDNIFYSVDFGMIVFNHTTPPNSATESLMTGIFIRNNIINGCEFGLFLDNPLHDWVVEDNTFNNYGTVNRFIDIFLSSGPLPNFNGIDFIEQGSLSPFGENTGNSWTGTSEYSFYTSGDFGAGVRLTNLDLQAPVHVTGGISTAIRECKIKKTATTPPITLAGGNDDIAAPAFTSASINTNSLSVSYQLNGNQHIQANADFYVDFYRANANGDLLNYIGSDATITTLTGGTYSANLTIPSGIVFGTGDKVGITVTGHHHWTDADNPITSPVAYISPEVICPECDISADIDGPLCVGKSEVLNISSNCSLVIDFGDGTSSSSPIHTYTSAGTYDLHIETVVPAGCQSNTLNLTITVIDCGEVVSCADCIGSFAPIPGEQYVVSAWVQQANSETAVTFTEPNIKLNYTGGGSSGPYFAVGAIIDGWQRIDAVFTVPIGATDVFVQLNNGGTANDVYFDDIRIHPLKASLKSFVYDPISMRLMAELDENNYATFYEYDEEGALIRVKKETERGVKTIKQAGNNTRKKP